MSTTLTLPSIHYLAILPVLILFGASLALLIGAALARRALPLALATATTVAAGLANLVVAVLQWRSLDVHGASTTMAHAVVLDGFATVAGAVVSLSLVMSALVAQDWARRAGVAGAEFHVLALAAAAGAVIMVEANDLIVVFLGLEILSLGLYVLAAIDRRRRAGTEAALKYFLLGGFASAVFIYGAALVYGATGTTNLSSIGYLLGSATPLHPGLLYAGAGLLLVGFAFKVAAVPFHLWSPDVYQGAPSPVTGFMGSVVKVGAFAAFLRVLVSALGTQLTAWRPMVWVLVVLSTLVGASLGVVQRDVKRMLAYSSINHAGFILLGLWAASTRGSAASLFYLMTYAPTVVASFAVVTLVAGASDEATGVDAYRGLARRQPWLGGAFALLLLSQLGMPLTTGFYAKFAVLAGAVDVGGGSLALIALLGAAIAAFFYLRWVLALYADDAPEGAIKVAVPRASALVIGLGVVLSVLFGLWPGPLATLASHATALFTP